MFDILERSLKFGLRGKHIHMDPQKALEGLNAETASMLPFKGDHSCWHILYHMVFWQDLMLSAIRGDDVDWPKNNDSSWLSNDMLGDPEDWQDLVQKFVDGLNEAEELVKGIQSLDDLPAWPKVPPFAAFMSLNQHNAYHTGEIVATRQALGIWPPPEYKPTF
ncbi:MAG: DinB family protein [Candidatus Thorarchaeota archaeon]|nr:DinB family protein [Candidatus Thorarchaeota archaeon]